MESLTLLIETKLLCMKKITTFLKNENVLATVIIAGVFILAGLITVFAIYIDGL